MLIGGIFVIVAGRWPCSSPTSSSQGKRIWRASPLHHHFEMKGWAEVTIVVRFWIVAGLFVAGAVGLFYLEWLSR